MKKLLFYTLYTRLSGFAVGRCAKERFGYRYLNWTPEGGLLSSMGGDEIPRGISSP